MVSYCRTKFPYQTIAFFLLISLVIADSLANMSYANFAEQNQWHQGETRYEGSNHTYKNITAKYKWDNYMGDWCDLADTQQGEFEFSRVTFDKSATQLVIDVTALVKIKHQYSPQLESASPFSMVLKHSSGSSILFHASESEQKELIPHLVVTLANGQMQQFWVNEDTFLRPDARRSLGKRNALQVAANTTVYLKFRLPPKLKVAKAQLRLSVLKKVSQGGVFKIFSNCHDETPPVEYGIAKQFPRDKNISSHPDVIFNDDFEQAFWNGKNWSYGLDAKHLEVVKQDQQQQFTPLIGHALKVEIAKGGRTGLEGGYVFKREGEREPESLYFRYYIRLATSWNTVEGGKLPGISGTYNKAGWGGRRSDGYNGWSTRGLYLNLLKDNPLENRVPIGNYIYHANMTGKYGAHEIWSNNALGYLEKNKWYCLEQYVKLNDIGKANGVLKTWVDGKLAFESNTLEFRKTPKLKIEKVWMNVYHGGRAIVKQDTHLYIDNIVIAKSYIGPLSPNRP